MDSHGSKKEADKVYQQIALLYYSTLQGISFSSSLTCSLM